MVFFAVAERLPMCWRCYPMFPLGVVEFFGRAAGSGGCHSFLIAAHNKDQDACQQQNAHGFAFIQFMSSHAILEYSKTISYNYLNKY